MKDTSTSKKNSCPRSHSRGRLFNDVVKEEVPSAEEAQELVKLNNYLSNLPSY